MHLLDILCCPTCKGRLARKVDTTLQCTECLRPWPVEGGVPFLLAGHDPTSVVQHEKELAVRDDYVLHVQQIMDSLLPDQVVLDLGAGERRMSRPQIVRMDVVRTPHVDVVGDAHELPFRNACMDLVYASSVFEHLSRPFVAAEEIRRVLKPGGTAIVDCAFVYPYHGYPKMYFNASVDGMRSLFEGFHEIDVVVGPWQMPSFAVQAILAEYVRTFRPVSPIEQEFIEAVKALDRFPVHEFDIRFHAKDAMRIAAGITYIGVKPASERTWVTGPLQAAWAQSDELRRRYPVPSALVSSFYANAIDSFLVWARQEGAARSPEIANWMTERGRFDKSRL